MSSPAGGPGNAALTGGAVEATFLPTGTLQKRYTILNAAGGLGGTKFTGVTDNAPGIVTSLSYDAEQRLSRQPAGAEPSCPASPSTSRMSPTR